MYLVLTADHCIDPLLPNSRGESFWNHLVNVKCCKKTFPSLKIVQTTVNTCFNYWYLSLWKTMKGINSLNDRLILCQNVEINSNEYFSYDVFSGMKSSNEIWRPRGMEMPLRNNQGGSEIFQIPILCDYYGLSNDHRCNSSSINHLLRLIMWTFFFFFKLSVIMEALFSVRCLRCVVVARM